MELQAAPRPLAMSCPGLRKGCTLSVLAGGQQLFQRLDCTVAHPLEQHPVPKLGIIPVASAHCGSKQGNRCFPCDGGASTTAWHSFLSVQLAMTLHPAIVAPRLQLDATVN